MAIDKLNIQPKVDNAAKKKMVTSNEIGVNETLLANEVNQLVETTNKLVDGFNQMSPITAFNQKGNVATYADLATIENPQVNDAYGVIADGLTYVYNGNSFPTEGNGMDLRIKPDGVVEEGNTQAVSGDEVYSSVKVPLNDIVMYEGYIEKDVNWLTDDNLLDDAFIQGKVYTSGFITEDYAGGAVTKIDKQYLIKLIGGGVYFFTKPYVTGNSRDLLLDDNLDLVKQFYTNDASAIREGNFIKYTIDLSDKYGDFYVALSLPNSSGVINKNITILNDFFKLHKQIIADGKVEEGDTRAVGGDEVYKNVKEPLDTIYDYEGYVEEGFDWLGHSNLSDSSFITQSIYSSGGYVESFPGGARIPADKTKAIQLFGGGVYNIKVPHVTNNVDSILYDENLSRVSIYGINRGNAVLVTNPLGNLISFTIDLSNYVGTYYLCVSTVYAPSTQIINKRITIENDFFKKTKNTEVVNSLTDSMVKNDLKTNQTTISKIAEVVGVYGANNAKYKINKVAPNSRISVEFNYSSNLTNVAAKVKTPFLSITNNNAEVHYFGNVSAPCTQQKMSYVTDDESYINNPKYNVGYYYNTSEYILNSKEEEPLVGENIFLVWLKGSKPSSMPTAASISDRSSFLELNQDYCIDISGDTFRILKDGLSLSDQPFGESSVIFSTSLKNNGSWKSIQTLYSELLVAKGNVLSDFYFEYFDLSKNLTCENIIQCGKIKLVGKYRQQTDPANSTVDYNFDSYPFLIKNNVNNKTHTLDIVSKSTVGFSIYVDGILMGNSTNGNGIIIGGDSKVVFKNLEYYIGNLGDAELISNKIISDRTPYIVGLMGHGVNSNMETGAPNAAVSMTRLADVSKLCYERGYVVYSAKDISDWAVGEKKLHKRAAFYMFDDSEINNGFFNLKIRMSYSQYGHPLNFAAIANVYYQQPAFHQKMLYTTLWGNNIVNHSYKHDVPMARKNSVVLYYELLYVQTIASDMYFFPDMFVYNWSGLYTPTYDMLKISGYNCAVNSGGNTSTSLTNRYDIKRMDISENTTIEYLKNVLF